MNLDFGPGAAPGDVPSAPQIAQIRGLLGLSDAQVHALAIRQLAGAAETTGTPLAGPAHALRLDQSRVHWLQVDGDIEFSIYPSGAGTSDRGDFTLAFSFAGALHAVTFPAAWIASEDSDSIGNRLATYVVKGTIVAGAVYYTAREFFAINEADIVNTIYMVGDLGDTTGPGFAAGGAYLTGKAAEMDYLLYAGDFNYPSGSSTTINANSAGISGLITAQKVLACHGNHDLDTIAQNWTTASSPMALAGTWRWSNSNQFATDFRTNAATSAGWATVTGGIAGFGEADTGTGLITDDDSPTYYFARVLNLGAAPTAGQKVRLRMYLDDGCQLFINGVLVYDFNLVHPVTDASLAHVAISATADSDWVFTERGLHSILVDGAVLQAGDNLVAVLVKQSDLTSSDISWDLAIDIGTTTDIVPPLSADVKYVNGYGQALRNKLPYLPNGLSCYHYTVGDTADVFVLNDGINSAVKCSNPLSYKADGAMHAWFTAKLAASTRPFKIVMAHRCAVSTYNSSSYYDTDLNWPEFKAANVLLVFGHTHQTCHYSHTSGQQIINASNSGGQTPRAIVPLVGSITGYSVDYADASTDFAVARIDLSPDFLRVRFEKTSGGGLLHSFIMAAP